MNSTSHAAIKPLMFRFATPQEAAAYCRERHYYWCERVHNWLLTVGIEERRIKPPAGVQFSWLARRSAGRYYFKTGTCEYVVPYAMMLGREYDQTIAHEVVHHYQRCLLRDCTYHGETFRLMMRECCFFSCESYRHSYSIKQVRVVAQALRPVQQLLELSGVVL